MAKHSQLNKMMLGGAALITAGTAAQSMSLGSAGCALGAVASGPVGASVGGLLGFASSFAGGWFSNRFHEKYKVLEYELNDPSDVLRNHFLHRLVTQAIVLGIRNSAAVSDLDADTVQSLQRLETLAKTHFEKDIEIADRFDLGEPQIERFFTGEWNDFSRVSVPSEAQWQEFLEEAVGNDSDSSMTLAVNAAAKSLNQHFAQLLFNNAKVASEDDRPAFAALELMLIRTLATTLAQHGKQLNRIDAATTNTTDQLASVKSELTALRESLAVLPSRLESRLVLPDLQPFATLQASARSTGLIVPGAISSVDTQLATIEEIVRATHDVTTETRDILKGNRTLLAKLPLVGEVIRDNANREWIIRELLSSGVAGCVALAEHRGKSTVFKMSIIENFARGFAREVEAATTLQDSTDGHARFCRITDSKLPNQAHRGSDPEQPKISPPFWLQLEHFPLGNLASWWKPDKLDPILRAERAAEIVAETARTVGFAHNHGVLHRDIKPTNILMGPGPEDAVVPYVSDFGIASFSDPERSASLKEHAGGHTIQTKSIDAVAHQGTLLYMAPELYERSADNRPTAPPSMITDIYSLGMILYWLLSGRQERPTRELVQAHVEDRALGYIIRRATHREPEHRFQTAHELAKTIDTRGLLSPNLTELEDELLTDADRLSLEKERFQASQEQRARADLERERAERQTTRALLLVKRLRWAAGVMVVLSVIATVGFVLADKRADGERLAKIDAKEKEGLAIARADELHSANTKIEYNSYVANIQMAAEMLETFRPALLRERLDACPEHLRGWEWRWFNARSNASIAKFEGHMDTLNFVAFSPDGTRIATASDDGTARVWDVATGDTLAELVGQQVFKVYSAAFSPDGTKIVTASMDITASEVRTARVWDAATGDMLTELIGHTKLIFSALFSPNGTRIATRSGDKTARVWDAATGDSIAEFIGHTEFILSISFSPDGTRIVTGSSDKTARVWDAETGDSIAELTGHTSSVTAASFSPNGTRIVTASEDHTARVWDATNGYSLVELKGHTGEIDSAVFSPGGIRIATASRDGTARVWDPATGDTLTELIGHTKWVRTAVFSSDGARIATASNDKTVRVWDAATGTNLAVLMGHTKWVHTAAFSPDDTMIVTASGNNSALLWDTVTNDSITVLKGHTGHVYSASFSPDGTKIVTRSNDMTARVWDSATGDNLTVLNGHTKGLYSVVFNPEGTRIVTSSRDKTARVWDAVTGETLVVLKGHTDWVYDATFNPDGTRIVTASGDHTARIWDATTGTSLAELKGHTGEIYSAVFSPDGTQIVTASNDNSARVWDAKTGEIIFELNGHKTRVSHAKFSPDGTRIVTASWGSIARVWDATTGTSLAKLKVHQGGINSVAFSPCGTRIATTGTSNDNTVRVWDAATGASIAELKGHTHTVISASFSPDGTRIITASWDGTARVWDATTGTSLAELKGHTDFISSAVFSPDGTRIVTTSRDGTSRVWDSVPYRERFKELQARGLRK